MNIDVAMESGSSMFYDTSPLITNPITNDEVTPPVTNPVTYDGVAGQQMDEGTIGEERPNYQLLPKIRHGPKWLSLLCCGQPRGRGRDRGRGRGQPRDYGRGLGTVRQ